MDLNKQDLNDEEQDQESLMRNQMCLIWNEELKPEAACRH